jgi:phosphopantothenoylcysteine decarboxylase/phosphopantothenate--cysteine ligase
MAGSPSPPPPPNDWPDAGAVQGQKVVLCVTGGIAVYKVVEVARTLAELGADVRVVMTPSARRFVGDQTFAAVSGNAVQTELFTDGPDVPHVELVRGASLVIVAPATANALAKLASGFADDLFSTTVMMARCPLLIAPAMHTEMWQHPATQSNVAALTDRGAAFIGPASGPLLSGDVGLGRLVHPEEIVSTAVRLVRRGQELAGRRVVVTAGGTQEPIDPVRFVGNRSSGMMGIEIARRALQRGAKVTLIVAPTNLSLPAEAEVIQVRTAEEMRGAVRDAVASADCIVMAAAVADFRPEQSVGAKIKKAAGPPEVTLVPTTDILAELGHSPELRREGSLLVGFAAETETDPVRLAEVARDKLATKGADVVVANDVSSPDSGFGVRTNRAVIADHHGVTDLGLVTKADLAESLLDEVVKLLATRGRH